MRHWSSGVRDLSFTPSDLDNYNADPSRPPEYPHRSPVSLEGVVHGTARASMACFRGLGSSPVARHEVLSCHGSEQDTLHMFVEDAVGGPRCLWLMTSTLAENG
eukprot:984680-Alexandrium_andersonii.AAC.1